MLRRRFSLILILALGATTACAQDLAKGVIERKLDNGLTVLMYRRPQAPVVAVNMRFRVGGVDETNGLTGIAHLLEHMLFKGTRTVGTNDWEAERRVMEQLERVGAELDAEREKGEGADRAKVERLTAELKRLQEEQAKYIVKDEMDLIYSTAGGVGLNASTGADFTTYVVSLPSNKLELWMALESDRMRNPVLREFYIERDNVLEERRQRVDSQPDGALYETFLATAYAAHPYRNPVIGWPSDIAGLPLAAVKQFLETYYAPNNAVLAIVGEINPDQVMTWLKRYFGDIPARTQPPRRITREPKQQGERRAVVQFDAQPELLMGFHKPAPPSKTDYVFDLINVILSMGRSSRFNREIVEKKQLAASVQAENGAPGGRYDSLFLIAGTPRHPHTAAELEAAVLAELERLKREPVTAEELKKARNQLKASFLRGLNSNSGLAAQLTSYQQMVGDWRYIATYDSQVAKLTADDIMQVARQYFTAENRTVASLVPASTSEGEPSGAAPGESGKSR
jgi:predicted Zn-dependent peptidase